MTAGEYDLLVIGGGPAGSSGATAASAAGCRVALIERAERLGGAGLNTGTIPSKALRESALVLSGARARKLLGVDVSVRREMRLADFLHHERRVCAEESQLSRTRLQRHEVELIRGQATFLDAHTLSVTTPDGARQSVSARNILIATGSSPVRPVEFDFAHPRIHDSNELLDITELPRVLAVVGAGVIGAEYASTFAALGVEVHVIDGRDSLLSMLDQEIAAALQSAMTSAGVHFHWKERVVRCEPLPFQEVVLTLTSGLVLHVTDVLVAAGRSSNTSDLNLAAAGLHTGERGLLSVDEYYRTEVPHIFAAGDVIGPPALAGTSAEQARIAVCHAFHLADKHASALLPTGIYTIPEASMAGDTEQSLIKKGVPYRVGRADYLQSPRGRLIGAENGLLKLIFRGDDLRLLGVHVLGEQATELVHIGLVAMHCGAGAQLFSQVCFNYPTLGDLYKYAAYDALLPDAAISDRPAPAPPAAAQG